jgi:hypothetical protein
VKEVKERMKRIFLTMDMVVIVLALISLTPNLVLGYADGISIHQGESNGVPYVTGGVGLDERGVMKGMADHYNVRLVFATLSGEYLADVEVLVQDGNNRMFLDGKSNGPWFFVHLPKGHYKVTAIHAGKKETREVALEKAYDTVVFNWKMNVSQSR